MKPSKKAERLIEDYIESSGSDRGVFEYIAGLERALKKCMSFIGADSLGDEKGSAAYHAAEKALS